MTVYDMPVQYRDDVPVNQVSTPLPKFAYKHYSWPYAKADWDDNNILPLIQWSFRKNVQPSVVIEALSINSQGGGTAGAPPREIVTDINGAYHSQVVVEGQPQDICPQTRMDRVIPVDTMPHLVPQSKWDEQDQFLEDSCDMYWNDLATSNANEAINPSLVIVNGMELQGDFNWYTTFRNTDATGLTDVEKRDWDDAITDYYIRTQAIFADKFPGVPVAIYTNRSYGWDGNKGRERMTEQAAQSFGLRTFDSYRLADVEWLRRDFIKIIQNIDRNMTGMQQNEVHVLDPADDLAAPIAFYTNPGPNDVYELQFRNWVWTKGAPPIVERLSYSWYESWLLNVNFAWQEYRRDNQLYIPSDRISHRLFWPRMFGANKTDWYLMARLCGASNIKSDLILQPAM